MKDWLLVEDAEGDDVDTYSQMAESVERLFSNTGASDREFAVIGEALGLLESQVKQSLIKGLCQSPAN